VIVVLSKQAKKDIRQIPNPYKSLVLRKLLQLSKDPNSLDIKELTGSLNGCFRLRIGVYRALFVKRYKCFIVSRVVPRGSAY